MSLIEAHGGYMKAIQLRDLVPTAEAFLALDISEVSKHVLSVAASKAKEGAFVATDVLQAPNNQRGQWHGPENVYGEETDERVCELVDVALQRLVDAGAIVPAFTQGAGGRFRIVDSTSDNSGVICRAQSCCALCGADGSVLYSDLRDAVLHAPGTWSLRRCTSPACGLIWLDPMPLPSEAGKFYSDYYTHDATASAVPPKVVRRGLKSRVKTLLGTVIFWRRHAFLTDLLHLQDMPPGRLLEVGCGGGQFLRQASLAGWKAVGIDFDQKAISAARQIPNAEAFVGDLLSMGLEANSFDAVVMNNVIEHLPMPESVFRECQRVLRPGGRLVMVTPNTASLGHKEFGKDWRGLEVPRHLHLFSPANLSRFARTAKFKRVSAFTSAAGAVGILGQSQAIRDARLGGADSTASRHVRRIIRRELASISVGRNVGEWAVLVAHK
ncbi:MAG TPA: class I SAM-dependent methyltransferase [Caldimonas sp.]|jgi:ubiquinone/menaquinone biosynthesis C-methylase UbiE|nr:class I SAM-dependent methyltransferase [Caldimonas sp.]